MIQKLFYIIVFGLVFVFLFGTSIPLSAQVGPVGPKSGDGSVDSGTPSGSTKPVDLPYKPSGSEKKKRKPARKKAQAEYEVHKPIPYIQSKSPEPLGAPDPEF